MPLQNTEDLPAVLGDDPQDKDDGVLCDDCDSASAKIQSKPQKTDCSVLSDAAGLVGLTQAARRNAATTKVGCRPLCAPCQKVVLLFVSYEIL